MWKIHSSLKNEEKKQTQLQPFKIKPNCEPIIQPCLLTIQEKMNKNFTTMKIWTLI